MISIAFYIASNGDIIDKSIAAWSRGPYSHCELVFDNLNCFSCSPREGYVRYKQIEDIYTSKKWDILNLDKLNLNTEVINDITNKEMGKAYDWYGLIMSQILSIDSDDKKKWFCSELCHHILKRSGIQSNIHSNMVHPNRLFKIVIEALK